MHGWWIFAGTAAVGLLSKYVITFRGRHIFNPSNFGLVLCFVLIGPEHADPLPFWWGPMSVWLALALALIVGGGLAILSRLHLVGIAVGFWLTFAAGRRGPRRVGARDDGRVASRADRRPGPLVAARHLAGDPRLPVLHDHRPAHHSHQCMGPTGVRGLRRLPRVGADRPLDDRVRGEAGGARRPDARLRGAAAAAGGRRLRSPRSARGVGARAHARRTGRSRGHRGSGRRGDHRPGGPADTVRLRRGGPARHGARPAGHGQPDARARPDRRYDRPEDRGRPRRRSLDLGGGPPDAQPCESGRRRDRRVARRPVEPDRRGARGADRRPDVRRRARAAPARARQGPGAAARRRDADRHDPDDDLRRLADGARAAGRAA